MNRITTIILSFLFSLQIFAGEKEDSTAIFIAQIENSLQYQTGEINLKNGIGKLKVPQGFKYLSPEQSVYVLSDLWGNPKDTSVLGLLVPEEKGVMGKDAWVFAINYDAMGFVKDDDADDIDYDELIKEMQKETEEGNKARIAEGYEPISLIGWASKPYYDEERKVLHWAKELKFGDDEENTLNYNLRVLGRKGVIIINAIAGINTLKEVQPNVDKVITSVEFSEGLRYKDFDPDIDEVAAWTVGGLVAGKVLAKVGILGLLAKFGKVIALGVVAAGSFLINLFRKKKKTIVTEQASNTSDPNV